MPTTTPFRFDADVHEYTDLSTGEVRPHITGMLARTGWVDDVWFTQEGSERGTVVHQLTATDDMQALDLTRVASTYKPWLLAYRATMRALRPSWHFIEVPLLHPHYRYGGRPDRYGVAHDLRTVLEIKSGAPRRADQIQTALQAILLADTIGGVAGPAYQRLALYLKPTGKFKLERHTERADFDEARRIIKVTC